MTFQVTVLVSDLIPSPAQLNHHFCLTFRTFEHAEKRCLPVDVIVEEHVTAVATTVVQLGCEEEGEAPGLRVVGRPSQMDSLALVIHQRDAPPSVIVVQLQHISFHISGGMRLPVQANKVPLDPRTDYGEGHLSPSRRGNYSTCRRQGNIRDTRMYK